jgi:hypothetical protein
MENTTENIDVIEVLTDLTVSDVKTLNDMVDTCLRISLFDEASSTIIEKIGAKLKALASNLEKTA